MNTQRLRSGLVSTFAALIIVIPIGYGIFNYQHILDWWQLRNYQAPSAVAALASQTTMNDKTRRLFYIQKPEILDKANFYGRCTENEQTAVLGCFISRKGIFVLDVNDSRLNGVEQVTAAHELLHAAYDRLNSTDKERVDQLVNDAYKGMNNPDLNDKIAQYKKTNADIPNELHSILGTEIADLPPELEAYYRQYFDNRKVITDYAAAYQSVFTTRKKQLEDYNQKLIDLEAKITTNNTTLDSKAAEIQTEQARLNELRADNKIEEYNSGVAPYNQKIREYNNLVNQTKQLVATYRSDLDARNKIAEEAQELTKALDSRISTRETK